MQYEHPNIVICLLDACNKTCKHCYRTMIPNDHDFILDYNKVNSGIEDAARLKTTSLFAGGEPTIWKSGTKDFLSLLIQAANRNGKAAFLSNGFVFNTQQYCDEFIRKYKQCCSQPLLMMFTVDRLHENYDISKKKILFLENILISRQKYKAEDIISIHLVSHWTRDNAENIPLKVFENYEKSKVSYTIDDFMTWGRAEGLGNQSCYLTVGSNEKASLGAFKSILAQKMINAKKVDSLKEFEELGNKDILAKMSVCGKSPNHTISWGSKYFYCIPQMGNEWFSIAEIGQIDEIAIDSFYKKRPVIKEIQKFSVFGVIDRYRKCIGDTQMEKILKMQESIRFAGCSICMKLFNDGILQIINENILDDDLNGIRKT